MLSVQCPTALAGRPRVTDIICAYNDLNISDVNTVLQSNDLNISDVKIILQSNCRILRFTCYNLQKKL